MIAIDCKYFSSKVDINDVDQVWGIIDDIGANLGVIVSNSGFTDGAKRRAGVLGRLNLCSILDLENKDFSINVSLPVTATMKRASYQYEIGGKDSNLEFSEEPRLWTIKNRATEKIQKVHSIFKEHWNKGLINQELGRHTFSLNPSEWRMIVPSGEADFLNLNVHYEVTADHYLGYVPLIKGKGILDIQEQTLKTRGFTTDVIEFESVQKDWEHFDSLEEIKIKPVFSFETIGCFSDEERQV